MKLVPKARPVRIRIKSSGEEHSSFDSLKKALSFEDLKEPACDGRLSNWLRQQDKKEVAERIDELKQDLASCPISDDTYLRFLCAIFSEDVDVYAVFSKFDLFDWWSKSKYNQGPEFKKLESEVLESRRKIQKAKEDEKMKHDFDYALTLYNEHRESRTQLEWVNVFLNIVPQQHDSNYWWTLYELTQHENCLSKAAEMGHAKAKELIEAIADRFAGITKHKFQRLFDSRISPYLSKPEKIEDAKKNILLIDGTKADSELKAELADILEVWAHIHSKGSGYLDVAVSKCFDHYQFKYLETERYFIQGLFYEMISDVHNAYKCYVESAKRGYKPAKLKLEQFDKGLSSCRPLICKMEKLESSDMTFGSGTRQNKSYVGVILSFIIRHLFDEYEV